MSWKDDGAPLVCRRLEKLRQELPVLGLSPAEGEWLIGEVDRLRSHLLDIHQLADYELGTSREIAQQALKEMRLLVYELRPPALEKEGLLGALHQRLGAVEKRAGVETRLIAEEVIELPAPVEEALYRITQEALNNALKHARATLVTVHIRTNDERVELEVIDDGQGCAVLHGHQGKSRCGIHHQG